MADQATVKRVSPHEALALIGEGYTYVDVRTAEEFAEGHAAGAFNVPLMLMSPGGMQPNPSFASVMRAHFPRTAKLVVGCKAGNRSLRAATALVAEGYVDVVDQRAGWDGSRDAFGRVTEPGWGSGELPTETGQPDGRSYAALSTGR
jgi:rhodanese-related sulfurtransferase